MTSALWIMLREEGRQLGLQERLRSDPGLVPHFVEEVLRLESPTQGLWRAVAEDTVSRAHGVLPAGAVAPLEALLTG